MQTLDLCYLLLNRLKDVQKEHPTNERQEIIKQLNVIIASLITF